LTAAYQNQRFSTGGHFKQKEAALSLYAALNKERFWAGAVAGFGLLQDRIAREVALGVFTDLNEAETRGRSAVLALRGGRDFQWGPVSTGPVLGLLHQHVQLRGFSESGSSGTTALSFGSQSRKAFVGQLGWRASVKAGHWQPFAQAAWERDLSPENRYVSASLRSVAAAPYVAAAAPVATDWATASAGTSCSINSRVHLRISARALLGTGWVTRYGGEGSLSVGF
jgi:outer membrane lipase/esterase